MSPELLYNGLTCVLLQVGHPEERDEGVLCEVQRPDLREAGEARHHDPPDQPGQYSSGPGRAERVSVAQIACPVCPLQSCVSQSHYLPMFRLMSQCKQIFAIILSSSNSSQLFEGFTQTLKQNFIQI